MSSVEKSQTPPHSQDELHETQSRTQQQHCATTEMPPKPCQCKSEKLSEEESRYMAHGEQFQLLIAEREALLNVLQQEYHKYTSLSTTIRKQESEKDKVNQRMRQREKDGYSPHRPPSRHTQENLDAIHQWERDNLLHQKDQARYNQLSEGYNQLISSRQITEVSIRSLEGRFTSLTQVMERLQHNYKDWKPMI